MTSAPDCPIGSAQRAVRHAIGIDENGLGPRMGPLVATGVRLRIEGRSPSMAALRSATGIDDSKRVFSPARRDRGEGLALGLLGRTPAGSVALIDCVGMPAPFSPPPECPFDAPFARRGACPAVMGDAPLPRWALGTGLRGGPASAFTSADEPGCGAADLRAALAAFGIVVERIVSIILCPGMLNARLAAGVSKLAVDLSLFETVAEELAAGAAGGIRIVCGKIGATERYAERFSIWKGRAIRVLDESHGISRYAVGGIGEVAFVLDADAIEPAVAMASVVGKYLREVWMDDLARSFDWPGRAPSGYHDALTTRFLDHAERSLAGGTSGLPAGCLRRLR